MSSPTWSPLIPPVTMFANAVWRDSAVVVELLLWDDRRFRRVAGIGT